MSGIDNKTEEERLDELVDNLLYFRGYFMGYRGFIAEEELEGEDDN